MKTLGRLLLVPCWLGLLAACGGPEIYRPCEAAADCLQQVPEDAEGVCLDKANEGFCSWACTDDGDCDDGAAAPPLVCASFESEAGRFCFPSCDEALDDDAEACPPDFVCRSTGGGSENRKICFPSD